MFAIAFTFAISAGSPPASVDPTNSAESIAKALVDARTNLVTGNYILLLSAFLLIVFAGYLHHSALPEEGDEWPMTVALGGGIVTAGVLVVIALIGISQGQLDDYGTDPSVARTLVTLGWNGMWMIAPGLTALVGATTLITFNYETLPRTIGFLGTIVSIVLLTPWWGLGVIGGLLWITATSITFGVRELRTRDA